MQNNLRLLFVLIISILLLQACRDPKSGALSPGTRTELDDLADDPIIKPTRKYIELTRIVSRLLDEAMAKPTEVAAMAHLEEFATENDAALARLARELDKWQKHMTNEERMFFVTTLLSEKSTSQLRDRSYRFRKRISGNTDWLKIFDGLMSFLNFHK
ncbi:MAG: hypothetical protein AAF696_23820, partial [Bacteroidota bacterium]